MHKYVSLTKALLVNSFSFVDQGNAKKSKKYLTWFLFGFLAISLLPSFAGLYYISKQLVEQLLLLQQEGVLLALTFQIAGLIIFFFAIFLIPAIFYFSKDIENLLSVPLRPVEIIAAKFTVTYIYETAILLILILPVLIAYVTTVQVSLGFIAMLTVVILTLPILPLIFSSVLVMAIMWLFPLFKNRDLFNMLSGLIILFFAVWINFAVGGLEDLTEGQLIDFIISGNNSLINIFKFLFVTYPFALDALLKSNIVDFGLYLVLTSLIIAGFLFIAETLYFRGVLGINETASRRKVLTDKQLASTSRVLPPFYRYFFKEAILLLRTPIYFLNCVSVQFIMPILLIAVAFAAPSQREGISQLISEISFTDPTMHVIIMVFAVSTGLIMGSLNMISATAISREGQNVYFMKIIPVPIMTQLHAKVASGLFYSTLGILIIFATLLYFVPLPFYLSVLSISLALIAMVFINYFSILIDVLRPKLVWESEQAAVKQNLNFLFTMIPSFGISALLVYLVINEVITFALFPLVIGVVLLLAAIAIIFVLNKVAEKIIMSY